MRPTRLMVLALVAASSIGFPNAWSQEANPRVAQQSKEPSSNVTQATQEKPSSELKAERAALQREAEAIEARHAALDKEIAAWSENLSRWMKDEKITIDPAQLVLALSSRSYFLHESKHSDATGDSAGYSRLEDQMKDIQVKRGKIEADWRDLLSRYGVWVAKNHVKTFELRRSFDFNLGDSTIPVPGISARQGCCPLTLPGRNCLEPTEICTRKGKGWERVCFYICDIVLEDNPQ